MFDIDYRFIEKLSTLGTSLILSSQVRKFEIEANQVLLEILQQLGRDPASTIKFFYKLDTEYGEGCNKPTF